MPKPSPQDSKHCKINKFYCSIATTKSRYITINFAKATKWLFHEHKFKFEKHHHVLKLFDEKILLIPKIIIFKQHSTKFMGIK